MTVLSIYQNSNFQPAVSTISSSQTLYSKFLWDSSDWSWFKHKCSNLGEVIRTAPQSSIFDLSEVAELITSCKEKINNKFTDFLLTPLHIAVMKGNLIVAKLLLANGANPNETDYKKYTPVHHAHITGDSEMSELLIAHGANPSLVNNDKLSVELIQRFTRRITGHEHVTNVLYDQQCFPSSVNLINEMVVSRQQLVEQWGSANSNPVVQVASSWYQSYQKYKQNPPSLRIERVAKNDIGNPINITMCGVYADSPIGKNTIITEYLGSIVSKNDNTTSPYRLAQIDAQRYRSVGSMTNDAFPNAMNIEILNLEGLPERSFLVAVKDIAPGEEITWDYTLTSDLKRTGHKELKPGALKKYFKEHSILELKDYFKQINELLNGPETLHQFQLLQAWTYLFSTFDSFLIVLEDHEILMNFYKSLKIDSELAKIFTSVNLAKLTYNWNYSLYFFIKEHHLLTKLTSKEFSLKALRVFRSCYAKMKESNLYILQARVMKAYRNFVKEVAEQNWSNVAHNLDTNNQFILSDEDQKRYLNFLKKEMSKKSSFATSEDALAYLSNLVQGRDGEKMINHLLQVLYSKVEA